MLTRTHLLADIREFSIIFTLAVLFSYFTNPLQKSLFFILTLFLFYQSKKDYLWIAFAFIITDYVGYFFFYQLEDIIYFNRGIHFSYLELFAVVAFVKAIRKRSESVNAFRNQTRLYVSYMIFLMILGIVVYGLGNRTWYANLSKMAVIFSLFYSMARLVKNEADLYKIANLMFLGLLINVAGQAFYILRWESLNTFLGGHVSKSLDTGLMEFESALRPVCGFFVIFFSFFFSTIFLFGRRKVFSKTYLLFINVMSIISVTVTATRGWTISFVVILALLLVFGQVRKKANILKTGAAILVIFLILSGLTTFFQTQIEGVWNRLATLELISQGDLTAGGTNTRLTTRSYDVMNKFEERPFFGWGFSETGLDYEDSHVGNQDLLMTGGVVGFVIMLIIIAGIFRKINYVSRFLSADNPYRNTILVLNIFLIGLLIIHSTSTELFGYLNFALPEIHKNIQFFMLMLFIVMSNILSSAVGLEKLLPENHNH